MLMALNLIASFPVRHAYARENPPGADGATLSSATSAASCAAPTPEIIAACRAQADRILAATVRLELIASTPDGNGQELLTGHGTVMAGRYILTHNHYGLTPAEFGNGRLVSLTIYKADGRLALKDVRPGSLSVIVVAPEALLLDFGDYGGPGLLGVAGLASAEFAGEAAVTLQPGMELAQIDWDGAVAHVVWTRLTAVHVMDGTATVELDSFVARGASGGGVFFNGVHIANNWVRATDRRGGTGEIVGRSSLAALNPEGIAFAIGAAEGRVAGRLKGLIEEARSREGGGDNLGAVFLSRIGNQFRLFYS